MALDKDTIEKAIRTEEFVRNSSPAVIVSAVGREVIKRAFSMQNVDIITKKPEYPIKPGASRDVSYYDSILGTPILADLHLQATQYYDNDGNLLTTPTMVLETVLLTINQSKNIVTTAIQGRDGSIKEYIGMGDYQVTINGILTAPNGVYPKQDLTELKKVCTSPVSITVVSWWLQIFDIYYLTIDSFDIGQVEGGYSYQPFSISALSDKPTVLRFS